MIPRPSVTKSNQIYENEIRTFEARQSLQNFLFLFIKFTALMCESNVFAINELKLFDWMY